MCLSCFHSLNNYSSPITLSRSGDLYQMPMEPGTKADLHILCDMAEDISVPQGTTPVMYAMCLLHGISQPAPRYEALDVYVCSVYPMPPMFRVEEDRAWWCISVTSTSCSLGPAACLGLPGMHAFILWVSLLVSSWVMANDCYEMSQRKWCILPCHDSTWRWVYSVW